MGRRIRWLALVLVVCFAAVLAQLLNIQFREATRLNAAATNPRNSSKSYDDQRGMILASNGQVLAKSVAVPNAKAGQYQYQRQYATGPLYSGIVGYDSPEYYGTSGVEYEYNTYLKLHTQKATTLGQLLNPPPASTDNVTLTVVPSLQKVAEQQMAAIPDANQDGAVTVLTVKTAAVLAMYSSPTYTNNALATLTRAKVEAVGKTDFTTKDHEGFYSGYPMATFDAFAPGSTFKVVTSSAVYNLKPSLETFTFPVAGCTKKGQIAETTNVICNDATTPTAANPCGGKMTQMLPESCDPGYALLGVAIGATDLYKQAQLFGFNKRPPIDLEPSTVSKSYFPTTTRLTTGTLGTPGVAYSAFGQETVTETDLQNVLIAEGIANTGTVMTPHVMSQIRNGTGGLVESYEPTVYTHAESASAAKSVNKLMQLVASTPKGTAYDVGFPSSWDIAVKTGTAQAGVGNTNTTDWMIGFAPAYDPVVAISVVVPLQARSASGAAIAGPIMKAMMTAALKRFSHSSAPPSTTTTTTTTTPGPATTSPTTAPAPATTIPVAPPTTTTTTAPAAPTSPVGTTPVATTPTGTTTPPAATTARLEPSRASSTTSTTSTTSATGRRLGPRQRRADAHAGRAPP